MSKSALLVAPLVLVASLGLAHDTSLPPGIWTNTEDVYFAEEEGREKSDWTGVEVGEDSRWRSINAFGEAQSEWSDGTIPGLAIREGGGWQIGSSELRLARPFTCWMSMRKLADQPDGSADWTFERALKVFDQGGQVKIGGGDAPDALFRLRNVTWAAGSRNAPSLVLYMHRDDPVRAVSYAWAEPGSERIGINLRWVQGSCTRDDEAMGANSASLVDAGQQWSSLYHAGNWQALRELYSDDATLMTQGQEKIEGADDILAFLQRLSQSGAEVRFQFDPEEAIAQPPFGFVTAKYRMDIAFPGRDPVQVAGRSYLVYKWENSRWKLWRDIDNFAPDATPEDFSQ
ncbi:MAG: DUF4440 domain-containing protein [Erythrobacter sp.]